jgi:hypothetical protein
VRNGGNRRRGSVVNEVICPICGAGVDVTGGLPDTASEESEIECECGVVLLVGWYATAEIRNVVIHPEVD